jgi:hypothetical protein
MLKSKKKFTSKQGLSVVCGSFRKLLMKAQKVVYICYKRHKKSRYFPGFWWSKCVKYYQMVSAHNPISLCSKSFWLTEFFFSWLIWSFRRYTMPRRIEDDDIDSHAWRWWCRQDRTTVSVTNKLTNSWQICSGKLAFFRRGERDETGFRISTGTCSYQLKLSLSPYLVGVCHQPDVCVSHDDAVMLGTRHRYQEFWTQHGVRRPRLAFA